MPDAPRPWVADLLARAANVRPCCDGACSRIMFLRRKFAAQAAREAGLSKPPGRRPHDQNRLLLDRFLDDQISYLTAARDGLRAVREGDLEPPVEYPAISAGRGNEGLQILFRHFEAMCAAAVARNPELHSISWLDDLVSSRRAAHARAERARKDADEQERRATLERRKVRSNRRAAANEHRARESAERGRRRLEFIERIEGMTPVARLQALAIEDFDFPIDAIPARLIPSEPDIISNLSADERRLLAVKLDRRRSRHWRPLREQLHRLPSTIS